MVEILWPGKPGGNREDKRQSRAMQSGCTKARTVPCKKGLNGRIEDMRRVHNKPAEQPWLPLYEGDCVTLAECAEHPVEVNQLNQPNRLGT